MTDPDINLNDTIPNPMEGQVLIYNHGLKWISTTTFFNGKSGTDGTSGSSGVNGIFGTSGINGLDGTSGTSGINGNSGSSGIDGTSGTSGTFNLHGNKDYQIIIWSGGTWQVTDKLIEPGSFTFDPKKGIMSYKTSENGHYEMVFFGSDSLSGMTNTKQGDILFFDGDDWINSGSGLTYSAETLSVSNLSIIDNLQFGSTTFNEGIGNKIPMIITKTDTGDPAGIEGTFCINTYDNNFKIYADGAWRTLSSW